MLIILSLIIKNSQRQFITVANINYLKTFIVVILQYPTLILVR